MRSVWQRLAALVRPAPEAPVVPTKLFKHIGERTPATDRAAEQLAEHALREKYPDLAAVRFEWVHHNQPDYWLVFAIGQEQPSP